MGVVGAAMIIAGAMLFAKNKALGLGCRSALGLSRKLWCRNKRVDFLGKMELCFAWLRHEIVKHHCPFFLQPNRTIKETSKKSKEN